MKKKYTPLFIAVRKFVLKNSVSSNDLSYPNVFKQYGNKVDVIDYKVKWKMH